MKMNLIKLLLVLTSSLAASATLRAAEQPATEDLGVLVENGKTNRILRVFAATPTYVHVILENNAGRKIPRQELPPQLAAKFSYDADKAAAYQVQQATLAAQQYAAQQAALQQVIRNRIAAIDAEIGRLTKQDTELQAQVNVYNHMHWGNGRKVRMAHLLDQQQAIREQVLILRHQLSALRGQL